MSAVLSELLRARNGTMSRDMVLRPGDFGLGQVPARLQPTATVDSICGYCSTGCSLKVHVNEKGEALNLSANPDYPVNLGMACSKGWEALTPLKAADRATTPLLRNDQGALVPADWERALLVFCGKLKEISAKHGPASVAFLSTGQIVNEEMALLGALAKFGMGMVHGDGNTRQCMATAVTAYKQSFGFDAPPYTYADFEESDVIVLWGSNLCVAHPIMWQRVMRNRHNPEIVVIDPRLTETAQAATQHYALSPQSDLVLLYGLARELIARDAVDRKFIADHTADWESFAHFAGAFTAEVVRSETGLAPEEFNRLAETLANGKQVSFWWTMGVNQGHQATRTAQGIINLALMTGSIGRPGTGANSITGQCNAMGSRLFSNTASLFAGRSFDSPSDRAEVARVLRIPEERIPQKSSWAYDEILDGIASGKIRALWVIATNPVHSWIQHGRAKELLGKLDFLVVQDMYASTETAQLADLVLPAAGWGEKEGTFINSERRIGLVKKVARAPGQALSDFAIFKLIAHYWGCGDLLAEWSSPAAVFALLKRLTEGKFCDISAISDYGQLESAGGIQWPAATANAILDPQRRLFSDGRFPTRDGRARFVFDEPRKAPEPVDDEFPFLLLTGRGTSAQWHTQTRTSKSDVLRKLYPRKIYAEIHPEDAAQMGVRAGETLNIRSRRGQLQAAAALTGTIARGQIFLPMHYPETNRLTSRVVDPHSRQPAYKACAVAVTPARK